MNTYKINYIFVNLIFKIFLQGYWGYCIKRSIINDKTDCGIGRKSQRGKDNSL